MKMAKRVKLLFRIAVFYIIVSIYGITVQAEEYDSGPVKIIYDFIGHYSLNYTGNTSHYDYWDASGTRKLVSRNYKDLTDIATVNNSSATIAQTDSESTIKAAYLIWQSRSEDAPIEKISFLSPSNVKWTVAAEQVCQDTRTNANGEEYVGVYTMAAEVTNFVCGPAGGYGTYTVADIPIWDGVQTGEVVCGGESVASWQLVVVEESPNFPLRTISLNIMSQYFFNIDYTVKVNFADASAPNGKISAQFLSGSVDVDSSVRYDGIGYPDDYNYEKDGHLYRYYTLTRGLYKNGTRFNDRDTGGVYGGASAIGATRVHLFDDYRRANGQLSQSTRYYWKDSDMGISVFLDGVSIDVFAYDIVFNGNGAVTGNMDNLTCIYGRGYNLSENQYVRPYWKFAGWNEKSNGSGISYRDKQFVRDLTATEDKAVLYAQWKPDAYKIILDWQTGKDGTSAFYEWYSYGNYSTVDCTTEIDTIIVPWKKGYIFNGYYTEKNGQGTQYVDENGKILSTSTTFDRDTILYAYWTSEVYKITLDNQGADTAGTTEYYEKFNDGNYTTANCTVEITQIELPTRKHHKFGGYYTEKNGEGKRVINENGNIVVTNTIFNKDTTLYAYWKPNTYIISLDGQEATENGTQAYFERYGVMNYLVVGVTDSNSETFIQQFDYTGSVQKFIAPYTGTYHLDLYGASGERTSDYLGMLIESEFITYGDWVEGDINLAEGDILYIYVGGEGTNKKGGWNGGGDGAVAYEYAAGTVEVLGGGGATDIRKGGNSLEDRVLVASGGAGGAYKMPLVSYSHRTGQSGEEPFFFVQPQNSTNRFIPGANQLNAGYNMDGAYIGTFRNMVTKEVYRGTVLKSYIGDFGTAAIGGGGGWYGGGNLVCEFVEEQTGELREIGIFTTSGSSYKDGVINGKCFYTYNAQENAYYKNNNQVKAHEGNGHVKISGINYSETYENPTTSITIPRKEGYRFLGYYTEKKGKGIQYIDESGNILSKPTTFEEDTTLYAHWIADTSNTYKIQFHGNGADAGGMSIMACNFDETYTLSANEFVKTGYMFTGWSTTPDGKVTYTDKASIKNLATHSGEVVTLYAKWTADNVPYKVNYYTESLTGDWELHSTAIKAGKANVELTLSSLKKLIGGFTYKHAEVKGTVAEKTAILADGSLIVNLYYTRNSYIVILQKDNGISTMRGAGIYKFEEDVSIDADVMLGYEWSDWSGMLYSAKKAYEFAMPANNVTIKANTNSAIYMIYLDNQRATESGTLQYYEKYNIGNFADSGCNNTIANIVIPERAGYTFGGYYTQTEGEGKQYIDANGKIFSTSTTFTEDIVLYAKWIPITYSIRFVGNGASSGSMRDMVCTYDMQYQLSTNRFTKDKYRFTGWNTEADGSGLSYIDKSHVENLCSENDGVITLYAQWTSNTYIVRFDANSGSGLMEDMECEFNVDYVLSENQFTKVGYDFVGWSLIPDGDVVLVDKAKINNLNSTTGTITLYAQWIPAIVTYRVNYYVENIAEEWIIHSTGNFVGYTGDNLELAKLVKVIEGFTYKHAEVKGVITEETEILANGSLVIDLYYTRNSYTLTLEKDSGIDDVQGAGIYKYGAVVKINAGVSVGYVWNRWTGTRNFPEKESEFIMPAEDIVMKANTNACIYKINLDSQNADSMGTEKYYEKYNVDNYVDASCNVRIVRIDLPKKTGYSFGGYYTEIEGEGTQYIDVNGDILSQPDTFTEDRSLYAYWIPISYNICFDGNGSVSGSMSDMSCIYDQRYTLAKNQFSKSNEYGMSMFCGWNIDAAATDVLYEDEAEAMNIFGCEDGSVTLYAIWDDCPWIIAEDLYYSLYEAQTGVITYDELMGKAIAKDREDGSPLAPGIDGEKGTVFTIIDYLPSDFTQFTSSGSVTETYEVIDSAGNCYRKMITVHIVDTTAVEVLPEGTTRLVNEKYYNETYENGGLDGDSVWKTKTAFVETIQEAFENSRNNTPLISFRFSDKEIQEMKEYMRVNGAGNTKYGDALQVFYNKFLMPNRIINGERLDCN